MNDSLTQIDAASKQHSANEQDLRSYLERLSNYLASTCSRANVRGTTEDFMFEVNDDQWVFGHLHCDRDGLFVARAFSGDAPVISDDDEDWPTYTLTPVREIPIDYLQAVSRRDVVESLMKHVQEEVLRSSDDLRNRVVTLASVALPPDRAAAGEFEAKAKELGFDHISAEWRTAQVNAIADPETAVRAASTMVEGVCKHILDAKRHPYDPKGKLFVLVAATRAALGMSTSNGKNDPLDRVNGSLDNLLQNIGALRNVIGDAHGRGEKYVKASQMQARLAVNAAGVAVMYLLDLWSQQKASVQRLGTAKWVLKTWVGGAPNARLTTEAKASLDRLGK